jgi:hypothetical protein
VDSRATANDPLRAFLPVWEYETRAATNVRASPELALEAVRETTVADVPLTTLLLVLRSLPSFVTGRLGLPVLRRRLFELLVGTPGFLELPVPAGMLAGGYAGRPWRRRSEPLELGGGPDEFADFDEPGYAKVTLHFTAAAEGSASRLVTETRIHLTDEAARRAFGRYWLVVRLGSGAIRRDWLRAARRHAEQGPTELP